MKTLTPKPEKDRAATEQRLLDSVGTMIAAQGFERIGVNAVAAQSGVSKILIYRYFGSVDGLLAAYIRKHDFWINFEREVPHKENLADFLKAIFRRQAELLHSNPALKRLYRWELSSHNEWIDRLRSQREEAGLWIIQTVSDISGKDPKEVASLATIISAAIDYLALLEDFCPAYNGIPLQTPAGWESIFAGVDLLIEQWCERACNV
ncbi:MAG: TetR/AcrR family transcriptional regulator [Bacteroidales bacterium]|jgi:AcrR family transcriptional regulator|nr:TetR/AcrR family transcriptional regulator [Bacteroidales bacterium]